MSGETSLWLFWNGLWLTLLSSVRWSTADKLLMNRVSMQTRVPWGSGVLERMIVSRKIVFFVWNQALKSFVTPFLDSPMLLSSYFWWGSCSTTEIFLFVDLTFSQQLNLSQICWKVVDDNIISGEKKSFFHTFNMVFVLYVNNFSTHKIKLSEGWNAIFTKSYLVKVFSESVRMHSLPVKSTTISISVRLSNENQCKCFYVDHTSDDALV